MQKLSIRLFSSPPAGSYKAENGWWRRFWGKGGVTYCVEGECGGCGVTSPIKEKHLSNTKQSAQSFNLSETRARQRVKIYLYSQQSTLSRKDYIFIQYHPWCMFIQNWSGLPTKCIQTVKEVVRCRGQTKGLGSTGASEKTYQGF